jgi:hypothetical protein
MASITESTPGHYDVIIRDVSKFTSVVDERHRATMTTP